MRARALSNRLADLAEGYRSVTDMIDGRVLAPTAPGWCERRNLTAFLLSLDDEALLFAETRGLCVALPQLPSPPAELTALCLWVQRELDAWAPLARSERALDTRHVGERKRVQVATFVEHALRSVPRPARIVDVGAGLGHLTRALASAMEVEAIGVEVEDARCRRATALAAGQIQFDSLDANTATVIGPGDFAVGLHACGDLGDVLLRQATHVRAHVMLVSCCMQKVRAGSRAALSQAGLDAGLSFSKLALGLSNLSNWDQIDKMEQIHLGRRTRHGLRQLLRARGQRVALGEETHGVHRRKFRRGLITAATLACAHRKLAPPTATEIAHFERLGAEEYAVMRRLELPRSMLGRLVECVVVLDRAAYLEEADYAVEVGVLVPRGITPRNLAIIARA